MCGIAGIVSKTASISLETGAMMLDALQHRGPDGMGSWQNPSGNIWLGHNRLSIIDLSPAAAQPMHFNNRLTITYNGELYNYKELKSDLEQQGYQFRTASDTEVILASYDRFGADCLNRFDGMFALAIWDEVQQELFVARDRMGEKPLYFAFSQDASQWIFASEIKALFAAGFSKEIEPELMAQYLSIGHLHNVPNHYSTFYRYIKKLPAAHFATVKLKNETIDVAVRKYWSFRSMDLTDLSEEKILAQFKDLLERSISRRLRSDVASGTSLSGGLDSGSIAALIAGHLELPSSYQHKSLTASFPGFAQDETMAARTIGKQFNLQQYFIEISSTEIERNLAHLLELHDEPISSASSFAQYYVFRKAKEEGIKVLLDGQGADELLGGYDKYRHWFLQECIRKGDWTTVNAEKKYDPRWGWKNYAASLAPNLANKVLVQLAEKKARKELDFNIEWLNSLESKTFINKPQIKTLQEALVDSCFNGGLEELLRYADRNSMAHGIEVRLPFLEFELIQFCLSVPAHYKFKQGCSKWILRKLMAPHLPEAIVWNRKKIGFEPPQEKWMQLKAVQERIIDSKEKLVRERILNASILDKKIQPHPSYAAVNTDWKLLCAGAFL